MSKRECNIVQFDSNLSVHCNEGNYTPLYCYRMQQQTTLSKIKVNYALFSCSITDDLQNGAWWYGFGFAISHCQCLCANRYLFCSGLNSKT